MPLSPSQRWTPFDVLSTVREMTGTTEQKKIVTEQGKYFYKSALSEIVSLLNSSLDPSYFTSKVLTLSGDLEFLTDSVNSGGVITSITVSGSTVTIVRSSGSFTVGEMLNISYAIKATGVMSNNIAAVRITSPGSSATGNIISGNLITFTSSYSASVIGVKSYTALTADLSTTNYDRIVSIEDSNYGQCVEVSPSTFASLQRGNFPNKSYDDDIVWTLMGNTIRFLNGSKVTNVGTKTLYYQRQPNYPVNWDDTEFVDLSDKWIPLLIKRIYTYILMQTENDIPKNLAAEMQYDYAQISAYTTAEIQNRMDKGSFRSKQ